MAESEATQQQRQQPQQQHQQQQQQQQHRIREKNSADAEPSHDGRGRETSTSASSASAAAVVEQDPRVKSTAPLSSSNVPAKAHVTSNKVNVSPVPARPARLPPTIDVSLAPSCTATRQAFYEALCSDQRAALEPNYRDPFYGVEDVIKRLLPYHVWNVRDEDIWHVLDARLQHSARERKGDRTALSLRLAIDGSATKRCRGRSLDLDDVPALFPTDTDTHSLWARYVSIHERAKRLRQTLTGGHGNEAPAPFVHESCYHMDMMAHDHERELYLNEQEDFRRAKEHAMASGITWEALMRISAGLDLDDVPITRPTHSSFSETLERTEHNEAAEDGRRSMQQHSNDATGSSQDVVAYAESSGLGTVTHGISSPSHQASSGSATMRGARPRGRPRKQRDEHGRIIRTPSTGDASASPSKATLSLSTPSTLAAMQNASAKAVREDNSPSHSHADRRQDSSVKSSQGRAEASRSTTDSSSASSIPTHPIRLVLPISALTRLSALGITPVPAPHLLAAVTARQEAADGKGATEADVRRATSRFDTSPRPSSSDQDEPAMLVGITASEVRDQASSSSSANTQEMIHVSVLLNKFGSTQLSGLAQLMQNIHGAGTTTTSSRALSDQSTT